MGKNHALRKTDSCHTAPLPMQQPLARNLYNCALSELRGPSQSKLYVRVLKLRGCGKLTTQVSDTHGSEPGDLKNIGGGTDSLPMTKQAVQA